MQAELEASLEKQAELEESLSASAVRSLQEQIGKLYWVNKELINQIRERDTQTKRLQVDHVHEINRDNRTLTFVHVNVRR